MGGFMVVSFRDSDWLMLKHVISPVPLIRLQLCMHISRARRWLLNADVLKEKLMIRFMVKY